MWQIFADRTENKSMPLQPYCRNVNPKQRNSNNQESEKWSEYQRDELHSKTDNEIGLASSP